MFICIKMDKEVWRVLDIDGINKDYYYVSNYGRVKNKDNHIMSAYKDQDGYFRICLCGTGKTKNFYIHRLVALLYLPGYVCISKNIQINHKDTYKTNNYYENLEWCTPKENIQHAFNEGLRGIGVNHPGNIYSEELVEMICHLIKLGLSNKEIKLRLNLYSEDTKVNRGIKSLLADLRMKRSWTHITSRVLI